MKSTPQILIVEDETPIRDMIKFALSSSGFSLIEAKNVKEAWQQIAKMTPDVILLDWMLPDTSGIDFLKQLKQKDQTKNIRVIMLTARAEEENKIKGLEIGADDYITKPFSPRELLTRIKALLRRGILISPEGILQIGKIILDTQNHNCKIDNINIELSNIEYKILRFFMTHPNRVYSREQLLNQIWGNEQDITDRTVDVQIKRLRSRLVPYDHYIKTVHGQGYQFIEMPQ